MTHLILDTDDRKYAESVAQAIPGAKLVDSLPWVELFMTSEGNNTDYVAYNIDLEDSVESRFDQLALASTGSLLLSNNKNLRSPLLAGKLPDVPDRAKVYLDYAKFRASEFSVMGLSYAGPTYQDPKNVILATKSNSYFDLVNGILSEAAKNWWPTVGFIRNANKDSLERSKDSFHYTMIVCADKKSLELAEGVFDPEMILDASDISWDDPKIAVKYRSLTSRPETYDTIADTNFTREDTVESTH